MDNFIHEEHGEKLAISFIRDENHLAKLCESWLELDAIAVDTEFDRTHTYYHNLALIQFFDGKTAYFIDPLEFTQLSALKAIFESETLIKVFHSCGEDLEALFNAYGFNMSAVFDTQVAAAMLNIDQALSYSNLVAQTLTIALDKEHTKTDWLQRPLTKEQLVYAAQDVQFLLPAYCKLRDRLLAQGSFDYVLDDGESAFDTIAKPAKDMTYYLRVKSASRLNREQLNRLQHICSWREQLARDNNMPRTFIFRDNHITELSTIKAPKASDLVQLGCHPVSIRKYGATLLEVIAKADEKDEKHWVKPVPAFYKLPKSKQLLQDLNKAAKKISQEADIPMYVLANKRLLEFYLLSTLDIPCRVNHYWKRWRKDLLAESFECILEEHDIKSVLSEYQ